MKLHVSRVIIMSIFVFLAVNVFLYTQTIVLGDGLSKLEKKIVMLKQENDELEKKSATLETISRLSIVAENMGFTKQVQASYINDPLLADISHNE